MSTLVELDPTTTNLPISEPTAQFHAKFWGKSTEEERDEERDEETDEKDVRGIKFQRIWIREEYIRIFDACRDAYDKKEGNGQTHERPPSFVITGQPGIGKGI